MSSTMTTNVSSTTKTVNSSEVGWQFVPQYYSFVNKQPDRLHCFYTKTSTFIHGAEGDESKPCYGQQEIHNRITEIGFQDCKVFIHSVDAQSSANGGIIIQVIGEMSNNNEAWRKFVQTFFLAEQPNGYFVLNDVFRYLKEESADGEDAESDVDAAEPDAPAAAEPAVEEAAPVIEAPPTPEPVREPSPEPAVVEEEEEEEVAPTPEPNGVHAEPEQAPVVEETPEPEPAPVAAAAPAPPSPAPAPPAPVVAPTPPAPAPAPAPALPKTWATLAAANSNKWGNAVAQESRGTTESPVAAVTPPPKQASFQPPQNGGPNRGPRQEHPAVVAAQNVTTAQCFVKGVTETVSNAALSHLLTTRFGPIKEIEIVRSKACAFLEFTTIEAAKKAILASLPSSLGGEGGLRLPDGERINVETKKERGERPPSRPRGGAPPPQSTRGGGGGAPRGGRGTGAPARGGRGGAAAAPAK